MMQPRPSVLDKRRAFHALHATGCFVIPNPWDSGSARYLESLGFKAVVAAVAPKPVKLLVSAPIG